MGSKATSKTTSWLGGAASAIAGSLVGGLTNIGSGKRARKLIKRQEEAQQRLNEQNAKLNYEYGEQAADAAHERSLGLLAAETEANSYQAQVADAEQAGLSVGLLYGGGGGGVGGSAGGGAQGDGAGNQRSKAAEQLEILSIMQQEKMANAEIAKTINESRLVDAEKEKIKAETENLKEETSTSQAMTPYQTELIRQQGIQQWLENLRTEWENKGHDQNEATINRNATLNADAFISTNSYFNEARTQEIAEAIARTEQGKAAAALDTERKLHYFQEILNATAHADADRARAAAIKLATEWSTGEYTNWKTWVDTAGKAVEALGGIIKGAAGSVIGK